MGTKYRVSKPEIWGGIECTINRVGCSFKDQLQQCGHYNRMGDIAAFAGLGIKKLRYPVLWERHEPIEGQVIDWTWITQQLDEIRKYDIDPIAGLLHHGSGPSFTSLDDPAFPEKFANYARKVATRFPWLQYYTPINEPHTTARFSGLYGFWYPHKNSPQDYSFMLLNELKATVLAMHEIRKINPLAKLVQTEDLSKTHSTPLLQYQARFENERRWLTFDILCGRVNEAHFFWQHCVAMGIPMSMLLFFINNPTPPDIMGFNYYVTSERFLDHRITQYPHHTHGGNGKHSYVDVEAARVVELAGIRQLLKEAWARYHLSMAVTEVHLNCTREEQMRWIHEIWDQCCDLKTAGVNFLAITAWSLIGAYDWCSLLTTCNNSYESGLFDLRNETLRPTATAKMIRCLASGEKYDHPLLNNEGWWRRDIRFLKPQSSTDKKISRERKTGPPILIIGKNGTLGNALRHISDIRGIDYVAFSRYELDICNAVEIDKAINYYKPWAIVNAAGYVNVDKAETDRDECFKLNTTAPALLAKACEAHGIKFMTISSDLVFDGEKGLPYIEMDGIMPLNVYGRSKAMAEGLVSKANPTALIIRSSAFFSPWDRFNFVFHVLDSLQRDKKLLVINDVSVSPTYVPDLVNVALDLLIDDEKGIWHVSSDGNCTWAEWAGEVALRAGFTNHNLQGRSLEEMKLPAPRPAYSVLKSKKGIALPALDNALERYFREKLM